MTNKYKKTLTIVGAAALGVGVMLPIAATLTNCSSSTTTVQVHGNLNSLPSLFTGGHQIPIPQHSMPDDGYVWADYFMEHYDSYNLANSLVQKTKLWSMFLQAHTINEITNGNGLNERKITLIDSNVTFSCNYNKSDETVSFNYYLSMTQDYTDLDPAGDGTEDPIDYGIFYSNVIFFATNFFYDGGDYDDLYFSSMYEPNFSYGFWFLYVNNFRIASNTNSDGFVAKVSMVDIPWW